MYQKILFCLTRNWTREHVHLYAWAYNHWIERINVSQWKHLLSQKYKILNLSRFSLDIVGIHTTQYYNNSTSIRYTTIECCFYWFLVVLCVIVCVARTYVYIHTVNIPAHTPLQQQQKTDFTYICIWKQERTRRRGKNEIKQQQNITRATRQTAESFLHTFFYWSYVQTQNIALCCFVSYTQSSQLRNLHAAIREPPLV